MTKPSQIDIAGRLCLFVNAMLLAAVMVVIASSKIKDVIDNAEISDHQYRLLSYETTEAVQDLIYDSFTPDGKITRKEYWEIERFEAEVEFMEKLEEWKYGKKET